PLVGVVVVGGAAQRRLPRLDADDAGQRVGIAGHVPDERHPVAHDDALAAQLTGPHRGDETLAGGARVHQAAVPAPVHGDHESGGGVLVRGTAAGARTRPAASGPYPDVVLVVVVRSSGQWSVPAVRRAPASTPTTR